jgi:cysteinyl-tRNA synthetase
MDTLRPLPVFTDSISRQSLAPPRAPHEGPISFYACGITPYSPAHIGHARSFVVFDLMREVLRDHGFDVVLVRNVTDIDDKIIQAAKEQGRHWKEFSHAHAKDNRDGLARLGVVDYEEPHASEHIGEIQSLIQILLDKEHAYVSHNGDVLFDVGSFQGAALMPHQAEDLLVGGNNDRVDHSGKRAAADFVLWKPAKPGEPSWESPWGAGRPGWHIECSAMVEKRFGATLDYHGGGTDLRFPHHQAEIQQSEAAFDRPLAHRWVHHGSVRDKDGKKMSKSLGNYVELTQALDQADQMLPGAGGAVLRLALLSALWTKPLDWKDEVLLRQSADALIFWSQAAGEAHPDKDAAQGVRDALGDNLNTPKAFAQMHILAEAARKGDPTSASALAYGLSLLGIPEQALILARSFDSAVKTDEAPEHIRSLLDKRQQYRQDRQWQQADAARQEIEALGYVVEDQAGGAKLRRSLK